MSRHRPFVAVALHTNRKDSMETYLEHIYEGVLAERDKEIVLLNAKITDYATAYADMRKKYLAHIDIYEKLLATTTEGDSPF